MTREEAIKIIKSIKRFIYQPEWNAALNIAIVALREPEHKCGRWIKYGYKWKCSECDGKINIDGTPEENNLYYCPNCGADMRGEQDDR